MILIAGKPHVADDLKSQSQDMRQAQYIASGSKHYNEPGLVTFPLAEGILFDARLKRSTIRTLGVSE